MDDVGRCAPEGGYRVHIIGTASGQPHVLPVPLPADRRNVNTDFEYLAAHLTLEISGRLSYRGETNRAGLEVGQLPSPTELAATS